MRNEALARTLVKYSYIVRRPPEEPFKLSSGTTSYHYFDCERTTACARALPLIAEAFYERIRLPVAAVGGPTRGADPIAGAIAYYSLTHAPNPINVFSIRKALKEHGNPGWVEGCYSPGDQVVFVDDVVTSGRSVEENVKHCRESELKVIQVIVLVDREEGGMERIREAVGGDTPIEAIFRFSELKELV